MTREADIERKACRYAEKIGYFQAKFKSMHNRAVPDRLFINPQGRVFFIEFKAPGKKATEAQLRKHKKMQAEVYVVDNLNVAKSILDRGLSIPYYVSHLADGQYEPGE